MKLLLAGEGSVELGDWSRSRVHEPRRAGPPAVGALETLIRRVAPRCSFSVHGGVPWKSIVKYRAGEHRKPETRTVLGLALCAEECGCDALVFVRDRDGSALRQRDIEDGMNASAERFRPAIVGGVAIEALEAWVLALLGERNSETHDHPKARLASQHGIKGRAAIVAVIERADLKSLPQDAKSLRAWCELASKAFVDDR